MTLEPTDTPKSGAPAKETTVMTADDPAGTNRGEVSAVTVARMMGLATVSEFKLVEGKVDLLSTKMSALMVKLEKVATLCQSVATGADLERVDVQIGSLKQLIRETLLAQGAEGEKAKEKAEGFEDPTKKPGSNIQTNG